MSAPIDWTALEDAIHDWAAESLGLPGASVYFVEGELDGAVLPPVPAAQIQPLTGPVRLFAPQTVKVPGVTSYRVRVLATGPGEAGINFYAGYSATPIVIPLAAGPGGPPATTAAALALAIDAAIPIGYSAAVDPLDPEHVIIDGSGAEPMFAVSSLDHAFTTTTLARARATEVDSAWSRMTWRVQLRSSTARGFGSASDMLARLSSGIARGLGPRLRAAGWAYKGTLASLPSLPGDRVEFRAALDFAIEGFAHTHYQVTPARQLGIMAA